MSAPARAKQAWCRPAAGATSFTYRVNDGILWSNVANVTLIIAPVNDKPVATSQVVPAFAEDTNYVGLLTGTDVDNPTVCSDLGGIGIDRDRSDLVRADPQTIPEWRVELLKNAVGAVKPNAPLLIFSGTTDNVVPPSEAAFALERYCETGAQ